MIDKQLFLFISPLITAIHFFHFHDAAHSYYSMNSRPSLFLNSVKYHLNRSAGHDENSGRGPAQGYRRTDPPDDFDVHPERNLPHFGRHPGQHRSRHQRRAANRQRSRSLRFSFSGRHL